MKFRVYHIPTKQYVQNEVYNGEESHGNTLAIDVNGQLRNEDYGNGMYYIKDPENYIVEYCSGVKDINGKDIYVGDIMKHPVMGEQEVVFRHGMFRLKIGTYFTRKQENWPIIGNIHESNI